MKKQDDTHHCVPHSRLKYRPSYTFRKLPQPHHPRHAEQELVNGLLRELTSFLAPESANFRYFRVDEKLYALRLEFASATRSSVARLGFSGAQQAWKHAPNIVKNFESSPVNLTSSAKYSLNL